MEFSKIQIELIDKIYPGLRPYNYGDAEIFGGRNLEIEDCIRKLYSPNPYTKILIIHGPTGCGKSSFFHAGVLPVVQDKSRDIQIAGEELGTDIIIRCGTNPLKTISDHVWRIVSIRQFAVSLPDVANEDDFYGLIRDEPNELCKLIEKLADEAPSLFVIFVDQSEEIFGTRLTDEEYTNQGDFVRFISSFSDSHGAAKLVIALRGEVKGHFDDLVQQFEGRLDLIKGFYLRPMNNAGLMEAIIAPTGVNLNVIKWSEPAAELLSDLLVSDQPRGGTLPVLQIMCRRILAKFLEQGIGSSRAVTRKDVIELGPTDKQLRWYIDHALDNALGDEHSLSSYQNRESWISVLAFLTRSDQDGRTRTIRRADWEVDKQAQQYGLHDAGMALLNLKSGAFPILTGHRHTENSYSLEFCHDCLALTVADLSAGISTPPYPSLWFRDLEADAIQVSLSAQKRDLFPEFEIETIEIETVSDGIWDHLVHLYAKSQGLFERLGIKLKVRESFKPDVSWQLASLPHSMVDGLPDPSSWVELLPINTFAGFALIGPPQRSKKFPDEVQLLGGFESLGNLFTSVADSQGLVVFDKQSESYLNVLLSILEKGSRELADNIRRKVERKNGRASAAELRKALLDEDKTVIGTAPVLAAADAMGAPVRLPLARIIASPPRWLDDQSRDKLRNLTLANVWRVRFPAESSNSREIIARVTSIGFLTTEIIRRKPESFADFIFGESRSDSGLDHVDRASIQKAIDWSYVFLDIGRIRELFSPTPIFGELTMSPSLLFGDEGSARALLNRLEQFDKDRNNASKAMQAVLSNRPALLNEIGEKVSRNIRAGWLNYYSFNYFDALEAFNRAGDAKSI